MTLEQVKVEALRYGYILRRVGHKRPHTQTKAADGTPVRDCYIPHIPCDGCTLAKTHRIFARTRKVVEAFADKKVPTYADMWPYILNVLEDGVIKCERSIAELREKGAQKK